MKNKIKKFKKVLIDVKNGLYNNDNLINVYCGRCKKEFLITSKFKNDFFSFDEIDNCYVCICCFKKNEYICKICNRIYTNKKENKECLCKNCYLRYMKFCNECNKKKLCIKTYNGFNYCKECFDKLFYICNNCGNFHYKKDAIEYEEKKYCINCYIDIRNILHKWNYKKKQTKFLSLNNENKLFMGLELEVEYKKDDELKPKKMIYELNDKYKEKFFHIVEDGSLRRGGINYGFEIVSRPATLKYHKQWFWKNLLNTLRKNDFISYESKTCGLHIHLDKKYFKNINNISKLLFFINKNKYYIEKISRKNNIYSKFFTNKISNYEKKEVELFCNNIIDTKEKKFKYYAVNLINSNTIELRFFKGTLNYISFISYLEFANSLSEFCIDSDDKTIFQNDSWDKYVKYVNKNNYYYLKNYLKKIMFFNNRKKIF